VLSAVPSSSRELCTPHVPRLSAAGHGHWLGGGMNGSLVLKNPPPSPAGFAPQLYHGARYMLVRIESSEFCLEYWLRGQTSLGAGSPMGFRSGLCSDGTRDRRQARLLFSGLRKRSPTARSRGATVCYIERWGWRMFGSDGTARVGVGSSGSVRRYRPHYHLLLEPVGDSDVTTCD
jgi:hypothetical protein